MEKDKRIVYDASRHDRMRAPENAKPWAVVAKKRGVVDTVVETWATRKRAEERAEELSEKWGHDHVVRFVPGGDEP